MTCVPVAWLASVALVVPICRRPGNAGSNAVRRVVPGTSLLALSALVTTSCGLGEGYAAGKSADMVAQEIYQARGHLNLEAIDPLLPERVEWREASRRCVAAYEERQREFGPPRSTRRRSTFSVARYEPDGRYFEVRIEFDVTYSKGVAKEDLRLAHRASWSPPTVLLDCQLAPVEAERTP